MLSVGKRSRACPGRRSGRRACRPCRRGDRSRPRRTPAEFEISAVSAEIAIDGVVRLAEEVVVAVLAERAGVLVLLERRLELSRDRAPRRSRAPSDRSRRSARRARRPPTSVPSQERSCASVGPSSPVVVGHALLNCRDELRPAREARAEREQLLPGGRALVDVGVEERRGRGRERLRGAAVGTRGTGDGAGLVGAAAAGEHEAHEGQCGARGRARRMQRDASSRHVRTL